MKIAILSDIHGNIFALDAVIKEIHKKNVDRVFFLGDLMGYYYHPKQVYQKLLELKATIILGNHEQLLFDCVDGKIQLDQLRNLYGSGHRIALEEFTTSEIEILRCLPESHIEIIEGVSIACYHGTPFEKNFYLYPDTDREIFSKCDIGVDFVFVGHSHYPFIAQLNNSTLINVGSIGQSRVAGGIASWCLLDLRQRVIEMQATPYSTKVLLNLVEKNDPDIVYLSKILKRGINED